jgi:hypothetical protein
MWIRTEFGVLVNLAQANEVTLDNGTVEAHFGTQTRPLAHRSNEVEARKAFDWVAQCLDEGKTFLDLGKKRSDASAGTLAGAMPNEKAL